MAKVADRLKYARWCYPPTVEPCNAPSNSRRIAFDLYRCAPIKVCRILKQAIFSHLYVDHEGDVSGKHTQIFSSSSEAKSTLSDLGHDESEKSRDWVQK